MGHACVCALDQPSIYLLRIDPARTRAVDLTAYHVTPMHMWPQDAFVRRLHGYHVPSMHVYICPTQDHTNSNMKSQVYNIVYSAPCIQDI